MRLMKFVVLSMLLTLSSLASAKIQQLDKIIAVVNDGIITESQLDKETQMVQAQLQQSQQPLPSEQALRKQVLDKLILDELQVQFAQRTGIYIDDPTLDLIISDIAENNQMTVNQLRLAVEKEGVDFKEFRDNIKRQRIISELRQRDVLNEIEVSPKEVERFLNSPQSQSIQDYQYRLKHILISLPEAPSPEQIQKAKDKATTLLEKLHDQDFSQVAMEQSGSANALSGGDLGWRSTPELPTIFADDVLSMDIGETRGPIRSPSGFHLIQLSDKKMAENAQAEVKKTKVRHILIKPNALLSDAEAQFKLEELTREIEHGKDFSILAKTYSEDLASSAQGGDLGWVTEEQFVPEFTEMMNNTEAGEISPPFKTPFGWHVLQVLDRKTEDNAQELVKQHAFSMIRGRKAEEKLENWLRQMRDEAYVVVKLKGYDDSDQS